MSETSVETFLRHYGTKGMKWGIRKGDITPTNTTFGMRTQQELILTKKLKNGGELNVVEKGFEDKSPVSQWLMGKSKLYRTNRANIHEFILKDKQGVDVGQATFFDEPKTKSMYLADIKISPDHRRKGYAKATLEAGIAYAKEKNYTELNMISSPMGAPLYESLGFRPVDNAPSMVDGKEVKDNKGDGWAEYNLKITSDKVKHADVGIERLAELIVQYVDNDPELRHADEPVEDFLAHFGVKGMKWGVVNEEQRSDISAVDGSGKNFKLSQKQKVAIAAGVGVAAIVAGAFIASHYNVKITNIDPSIVNKGKEQVNKILQRPDDIIYVTKPHKAAGVTKDGITRTALGFVSKGNTKDFFKIFDDAGLNSPDFKAGDFKKLPNGDVATIIGDLMGRTDAAGRLVPHSVLIPAEQATGLNSIDDVIRVHGPRMERLYQEHLEKLRSEST